MTHQPALRATAYLTLALLVVSLSLPRTARPPGSDRSRRAGPQALAETLHLQWVRELPPLKPAWPDQPKLQFDAVYQPVVYGLTLFLASSRTDSVTAYDSESGAEKWRFVTDGPVRFA